MTNLSGFFVNTLQHFVLLTQSSDITSGSSFYTPNWKWDNFIWRGIGRGRLMRGVSLFFRGNETESFYIKSKYPAKGVRQGCERQRIVIVWLKWLYLGGERAAGAKALMGRSRSMLPTHSEGQQREWSQSESVLLTLVNHVSCSSFQEHSHQSQED